MGGLLSLDMALAIIGNAVLPLKDSEEISLADASGRVNFYNVIAPYSLPRFDNTGVDGYAFRHSDQLQLKLVGSSFAGEPFTGTISEGMAVRIATGGVLPDGADTVVMQEDCEINDCTIIIKKLPVKGANIRPKGADIKEGDIVLKSGQILQPQHIAILGALGFKTAKVFRKIKIAVASTGLELKEHGSSLSEGQIIDTNSLMIKQMIGALGDATVLVALSDDYDATCETLKKAASEYDLIITSGGVSVGDRDFVHAALKNLGKIHFWKLAIRPGKPVIFGEIDNCFMLGLPGNPVSSLVTFLLMVQPLLRALTNRKSCLPPAFKIPLAAAIKKDVKLRSFPRARLENIKEEIRAMPYKDQSSNLLASITTADGLLDLSEESGDQAEGDMVYFRPFSGWFE